VNKALMKNFGASDQVITLFDGLQLSRFPYPAWKDTSFALIIRSFLPLSLMLALFYTALCITKSVVAEKESGIRETLKMMGVQGWMQWAAWFLQYFLFLFVSVVLICGVAKLGNVLEHTDGSLFFVFMLLFAVATINFMFFISVFFDKATTAAGVAGLLWFCSWLPYKVVVLPHWQLMSNGEKTAACLISTTAMSIGSNVIGIQEGLGEGVRWDNMYDPISVDDTFTFATVLHMLLVDILLYGLLTLYFDAIFPGRYGVPKPWHFVFTAISGAFTSGSGITGSRVRRGSQYSMQSINRGGADGAGDDDDDELLVDGEGNKVGIEIRKLRKVFKTSQGTVVAVNDNSVSMYEGQVTALLGHNGAGKTTTMSMLSGMIPPTSGTAIVNGHDITTSLSGAQASIGFCPQHNTLFDQLTVAEHLWFFCKLKLISDKVVYRYVDEMIADLELLNKRHAVANTLSGGMKRKLSCGIALVGGSPVVILDEPTSGCDPSARRAIWDLLIKNKPGRTMLLSTHFMDEADVLGDRIAIMVNGRVECVGSPMELKSQYGIGYHLSVVKRKNECDVGGVMQVVKSHIVEAAVQRETGAEMTIVLPKLSAAKFPALFGELEKRQDVLGIESFGVSVTTIEEVFMKVGEDDVPTAGSGSVAGQGAPTAGGNGSINSGGTYGAVSSHGNGDESDTGPLMELGNEKLHASMYSTGMALQWQHFVAMMQKRWLHVKRNRWTVVTQLVVPVVFVLLALSTAKSKAVDTALPPKNMLVSNYGTSTVVYGSQDITSSSFTAGGGAYYQTVGQSADSGNSAVSAFPPTANILASFEYQAKAQSQDMLTESLNSAYDAQTGSCIGNGDACMEVQLAVALPNASGVPFFNTHTLVALSENVTDGAFVGLTAWFNAEAYHSSAESLAFASNVILGSGGGADELKGSISTSNSPLPRGDVEKVVQAQASSTSFTVALLLQLGMSFFSASFVDFVVAERASKAKHMQFLGGVRVGMFWGSAILFDFLNYLVPALTIVVVFAGFNVEEFSGPTKSTTEELHLTFDTPHVQLGNVTLLLLAYGLAVIPLSYFASFFFTSAAVAYNRLLIFNVLTGTILVLAVFISASISTNPELAHQLTQYFEVLPTFAFGQGVIDLYQNFVVHKSIGKLCGILGPNGFDTIDQCCDAGRQFNLVPNGTACPPVGFLSTTSPGIGTHLLVMVAEGAVLFVLVVCIDLNLHMAAFRYLRGLLIDDSELVDTSPLPANEDEDVKAERERVTNGDTSDDIIVMDALSKRYAGAWCGAGHKAVDRLCVGIEPGTCFGLLGVNGAGKTSTFKMLTGDESISRGTASLDGFDIKTQMAAVRQRIGYAPQFDALIELMTGRELLQLHGRLRGIPEDHLEKEVNKLLQAFSLERYADKFCKTYSGGNKRKLSTGMALIGNPPIVMLDEPTSGMDPRARRYLWDALQTTLAEGTCIVLTSHSMEECESLCSRIAIMVNGEFKCIGSNQHLKSRFGKGFNLLTKVQDKACLPDLQTFLREHLPSVEAGDQHALTLQWSVTENVGLAKLFEVLEAAKQRFQLADYSVSQTTLEQVFIDFARNQDEVEEREHLYRSVGVNIDR
jgi:ATP-binding cassette subfamily A (ABC1) protein 3